jgi:cytochrome c oxidase assembly protein subunit 15
LAQAFFCAIVAIALFTSPGWQDAPTRVNVRELFTLRRLALVTIGVVYLQILLGAVVRHTGAGLVIPDFPLAYGRLIPPYLSQAILIHFLHRLGAIAVSVCVILLVIRIVKHHRQDVSLLNPAMLLTGLLVMQLVLGALIIWSKRAVVPTTAHVAFGAALLATTLVVPLRSFHLETRLSDPP